MRGPGCFHGGNIAAEGLDVGVVVVAAVDEGPPGGGEFSDEVGPGGPGHHGVPPHCVITASDEFLVRGAQPAVFSRTSGLPVRGGNGERGDVGGRTL